MARSESQGLQIAVILLTMCVVGLAIATWVYYQAADTNLKLKQSAESTAKTEKDRGDKLAYANKIYMHVIGDAPATKGEIDQLKTSSGGDPTAEAVLAKFEKLMTQHEKAVAGEAKGLSALPDYLTGSIALRNEQLTQSVNRENVLVVEKKEIDTRETGRTATAEQGMKKAVDDLAAERDAFNKERDDFKKNLEELKTTINQRDKQLKELSDKSAKELADAQNQLAEMDKDLQRLRDKILAASKDGPDYESPDGQITWVNQRQRLAWIDVGFADGLTRQTTFSVYDHDENGVSSAKRKARIEVIRITEPHLAECRILEDDLKSPILPGDKIFTPAWSPGQRLHFAINGALHIDQDKNPDNAEVRQIIELNGGEVDAEVKPDGTLTGKLTTQTRYLIRGKAPSEKAYEGAEGKNAFENWSNMTGRAEKDGVEIIDISRFLNMMGWKAQDRTTTLGGKKTASRRSSPSASKPAAEEVKEDTEDAAADEKPSKPETPSTDEEDPFGK